MIKTLLTFALLLLAALGSTSAQTTQSFPSNGGPASFSGIDGRVYVDGSGNSSISAAVAACPKPGTAEIPPSASPYQVISNVTIPATCALQVDQGATINIQNTFTLTINGPIIAPPVQIFTYDGTGKVVLGAIPAANPPVYDVWFPGSDRISQWQSAYNAMPATGGSMYWTSSGSCLTATSSATFATTGKILNVIALGPTLTNGATNTGPCITWLQTSGTMLTIDWTPTEGGGNNPGGGFNGGTFIENSCNTNGGCAATGIGIQIGGSNGGAQNSMFQNMYFRGWGKGVSLVSPVSFNEQWLNDTFEQNTCGFSEDAIAMEFTHFIGGQFLLNGQGYCMGSSNTVNQATFDGTDFDGNSSYDLGGTCNGTVLTLNGTHMENNGILNSHKISCGANGTVYFNGVLAMDDQASGNTDYWFQGLSVHGTLNVSSGGRTVTNLLSMSSAGSDIDVNCTSSALCGSAGVPLGLVFAGSNNTLNINGPGIVPHEFAPVFRGRVLSADQGTPCTNSELALSTNWAVTGRAAPSNVAGTGQTCSWTITTGTTTGANPTITDTLTNPLPVATTKCWMIITGGTRTPAAGDSFDQTALSATAPVFTFQGTPTAGGKTYSVTRSCGP